MGLPEFTETLREQMRRVGWNQSELAREAGVAAAMVSSWLAGKTPHPDPYKVFAVERALRLPPGHLSQHLGYVPAPAQPDSDQLSIEEWLATRDELTDDQADVLLRVYRVFVLRNEELIEATEQRVGPKDVA